VFHGKSLTPLRGVTHVAWSCGVVSVLQKELMDGCDDSRMLRSLADLLQGKRKCRKMGCVGEALLAFCPRVTRKSKAGNQKPVHLTLLSIFPGGRCTFVNLVLLLSWACEDGGGEGKNSLLLSARGAGRELPSPPSCSVLPRGQLFPGFVLELIAFVQNYQVPVAAKGTCYVSPTGILIQFDIGGSGLRSLTDAIQKWREADTQSCSLPSLVSTRSCERLASSWPWL